ncbi:hypothetical protein, partial [Salmonella sp. SAL04269]|uniref:hypothetical protein n=1 Tax=Salmonella sp. SAL04269 TaxID=3159847 RepID=UPI00397C2DB0
GDPGAIGERIRNAGLEPAQEARAGDVLLMRAGPGQLHLAVKTAHGFVHADAGLGRVVERPGDPGWEVLSIWRRLS